LNRSLPSLRRVLALGGAVAVGVVAALALASPASAHHTGVVGKADCDLRTGEYVVTWTVTNDFSADATITQVIRRDAGAGVTLSGIAVGGVVPGASGDTKGSITGTQRVPGNSTKIGLLVRMSWPDQVSDAEEISLTLEGTCVKGTANPSATVETKCDSVIIVHLKNGDNATLDAELFVTGKDGWKSETVTLGDGETADVTVPAANSAHIEVFQAGANEPFLTNDRVVPASCTTLPKTGTRTIAIAASAAGLLLAGSLLFLVARRRRVRFTV
jgi:LPXTG-motif cell wall-anchored protein